MKNTHFLGHYQTKFSSPNLAEHEKSPYTLVHHLVEELIKYGGKEID